MLSLDDPEIFKYPVLYLIEPSWWDMTDGDAVALRQYLDKGGFVIVDDFKTEQWRGGRGWAQFADNMERVKADARVHRSRRLAPDLPPVLRHRLARHLPAGVQQRPSGLPRALFVDNDPSKRLSMFVAYNTDISQFWEWSERGLRPMAQTNEAYKLGVNSLIYGLTH